MKSSTYLLPKQVAVTQDRQSFNQQRLFFSQLWKWDTRPFHELYHLFEENLNIKPQEKMNAVEMFLANRSLEKVTDNLLLLRAAAITNKQELETFFSQAPTKTFVDLVPLLFTKDCLSHIPDALIISICDQARDVKTIDSFAAEFKHKIQTGSITEEEFRVLIQFWNKIEDIKTRVLLIDLLKHSEPLIDKYTVFLSPKTLIELQKCVTRELKQDTQLKFFENACKLTIDRLPLIDIIQCSAAVQHCRDVSLFKIIIEMMATDNIIYMNKGESPEKLQCNLIRCLHTSMQDSLPILMIAKDFHIRSKAGITPLIDTRHLVAALKHCRDLESCTYILKMMATDTVINLASHTSAGMLSSNLTRCLDQSGGQSLDILRLLETFSVSIPGSPSAPLIYQKHCSAALKYCRDLESCNYILQLMAPRNVIALDTESRSVLSANLMSCLDQSGVHSLAILKRLQPYSVSIGDHQYPLIDPKHCCAALKYCRDLESCKYILQLMAPKNVIFIGSNTSARSIGMIIVNLATCLKHSPKQDAVNILQLASTIKIRAQDFESRLICETHIHIVVARQDQFEPIKEVIKLWKDYRPNVNTIKLFLINCPNIQDSLSALDLIVSAVEKPPLYGIIAGHCKTFETCTHLWEHMNNRGISHNNEVFGMLAMLAKTETDVQFAKTLYTLFPREIKQNPLIQTAMLAIAHTQFASGHPDLDAEMQTVAIAESLLSNPAFQDAFPRLEPVPLSFHELGEEGDDCSSQAIPEKTLISPANCQTSIYKQCTLGSTRTHFDAEVIVPVRSPHYDAATKRMDFFPEELVSNIGESIPPGKTARIFLGINANERDKYHLLDTASEIEARVSAACARIPNIQVVLVFYTWESDSGKVPFGWLRNTLLREIARTGTQARLLISMDADTRVNPTLLQNSFEFSEENEGPLSFRSYGYWLDTKHTWARLGTELDFEMRRALQYTSHSKDQRSATYPSEAYCVLSGNLIKTLTDTKIAFDPYGNDGRGLANSLIQKKCFPKPIPREFGRDDLPVVHNVARFESRDIDNMICFTNLSMGHGNLHFAALQVASVVGKGVSAAQIAATMNIVSPFRLLKYGMSFEKLQGFRAMLCGQVILPSCLKKVSVSQKLTQWQKKRLEMQPIKERPKFLTSYNKHLLKNIDFLLSSYFSFGEDESERYLVHEILSKLMNPSDIETCTFSDSTLLALRLIEKWVDAIVTFLDVNETFRPHREKFLARVCAPRYRNKDGRCSAETIFKSASHEGPTGSTRVYGAGLSSVYHSRTEADRREVAKGTAAAVTPTSSPAESLPTDTQRQITAAIAEVYKPKRTTPKGTPQAAAAQTKPPRQAAEAMDEAPSNPSKRAKLRDTQEGFAAPTGAPLQSTEMASQSTEMAAPPAGSRVKRAAAEKPQAISKRRRLDRPDDSDDEDSDYYPTQQDFLDLDRILKYRKVKTLFNILSPDLFGHPKELWNDQMIQERLLSEIKRTHEEISLRGVARVILKLVTLHR